MKGFFLIVFLAAVSTAYAQRPFYAGIRPIGYPELADRFKTDEDETPSTSTVSLANRIGEDGQPITTTTQRLPVDALGDQRLVDRISKWPVDKQPYWYINWKLIEAHRQQRPTLAPETTARAQTQTVRNQNQNVRNQNQNVRDQTQNVRDQTQNVRDQNQNVRDQNQNVREQV